MLNRRSLSDSSKQLQTAEKKRAVGELFGGVIWRLRISAMTASSDIDARIEEQMQMIVSSWRKVSKNRRIREFGR